MSNSLEQPPVESASDRKENFEDFGLEIGDRVYSKSGTYREVKDIVEDELRRGGGYIEVERVGTNGSKKNEDMSFQGMVESQESIERIEKPQLPEDIETRKSDLSPRHQAALKQLEQIEKELKNPETPPEGRSDLYASRATIMWSISEAISSKSNKTEELTPERQENIAKNLVDIVRLRDATQWRQIIEEKVLIHEAMKIVDDEGVYVRGHSLDAMLDLGKRLIERAKHAEQMLEEGAAQANWPMYGMTFVKKLLPPKISHSPFKREILGRGDEPIYMGLAYEVARQMRKMIAVGIESDPNKREKLLYKSDTHLTEDNVNNFVVSLYKNPQEVIERQMGMVRTLDDESKRTQYSFATRLTTELSGLPLK